MNLIIISPFPPFRGGISNETKALYDNLIKNGHKVKIISFRKLYPDFFFPGKSQYLNNSKNNYRDSFEIIDTLNPYTWIKAYKIIKKYNCKHLIFRYWHPILIPAYLYIINRIKKENKNFNFHCMCDNAYPHESFFINKFFINYFFKKNKSFLAMSSNISKQISIIAPKANIKKTFLPIKENLPRLIPQNEAKEKLKLYNKGLIFLFFGLIRAYKGLDILLNALKILVKKKKNFKLIIAGESYENINKYKKIIKDNNLNNNILWFDKYIPDNEINIYFSACDLVILPYKSASQSGIIPLAYNYNKPILASNINGLKEYVINGKTGYLYNSLDSNSLADSLESINFENCIKLSNYINNYKKQYSIDNLTKEIISFINNEKS